MATQQGRYMTVDEAISLGWRYKARDGGQWWQTDEGFAGDQFCWAEPVPSPPPPPLEIGQERFTTDRVPMSSGGMGGYIKRLRVVAIGMYRAVVVVERYENSEPYGETLNKSWLATLPTTVEDARTLYGAKLVVR